MSTILIADDEQLLLRALKRVLSRAGFIVLTAKNGYEAVSVFLENKDTIDLCIFDMNMPEGTGIEALTQIRTLDEKANIVLASGESHQEVWAKCTEFKPNGVLEKPFALGKLLQQIEGFLN